MYRDPSSILGRVLEDLALFEEVEASRRILRSWDYFHMDWEEIPRHFFVQLNLSSESVAAVNVADREFQELAAQLRQFRQFACLLLYLHHFQN